MHRMPASLARALLAGAFLIGSTAAFAANHTVTVGGNAGLAFTPAKLNIAAGDTVTFTNAGGFHNVVSDPGALTAINSGPASSDPWTTTVTFSTPGTIRYYCEIHGGPNGQGMAGVINVTVPVEVQSFEID